MNDVMATMKSGTVNGIDVDALKQVVSDVSQDSAKGMVRFQVKSAWQGQTRSRDGGEDRRPVTVVERR